MKGLLVILAAVGGVILNQAGAWIVHHDQLNYNLPGSVSTAAEMASILGPALWGAGILLACPLALGWARGARAFWKLIAIEALAYLTLVCGLGSAGALGLLAFGGATVFLWVAAFVLAAVSPAPLAQGAAASGQQAVSSPTQSI